jgi:carboxylate-amine ligase
MARQVGVEEELLLVDPGTGRPKAVARTAIRRAAADGPRDDAEPGGVVEEELQQEQIETDTRPCLTLEEVRGEVRRWRRAAAEMASGAGAHVAALGTSPLDVVPTLTPEPRYQQMLREFGLTAAEQLTCGCHVHVEVASDEEGVAAMDRIRVWLPVLIALTANSPFYQGRDSGYESFRTQVWHRWPSAGPTGVFGTPEAYHRTVRGLVATGTLLDAGMVYFDARPAQEYPTLEIRVGDVCLDADDTVLLAALCRALVSTAVVEAADGAPPPDVRTELLRVASWRAARSGLGGSLVDPRTLRPAPAEQVLDGLVTHVRPALEDAQDRDTVIDLLSALRRRGNGAARQREAFSGPGSSEESYAVAATLQGV